MNTPSDVKKDRTPGRPGLSFEAYEKAYIELAGADGTPPSQRQIRKYLGTGSNTTLAGYRRRISEEQISDDRPLEAGSLDAELLETVQRLSSQIALSEAQVADDRVDEINRAAEKRIKIAESTMEKRLQDTALLEYRATTAEKELVQLKKLLATKDLAVSDAEAAHHAAEADNAKLTQSLVDAERKIAHHSAELRQGKDALDVAEATFKDMNQESKSKLAESQHKLTLATQSHSMLVEKHTALETRFADRLDLIESKDAQLQDMQLQLNEVSQHRESALVQLEEIHRKHEEFGRQCSKLTVELHSEKRMHQAAIKQFETVRAEQESTLLHLQATVTALSRQVD